MPCAWSPSRRIARSAAVAVATGKPATTTLPPGMGETVDLIAQRLVTHAAPYVQQDPAMQARIGAAAGAAAAERLSVPVTIAAAAVTLAAAFAVYRLA